MLKTWRASHVVALALATGICLFVVHVIARGIEVAGIGMLFGLPREDQPFLAVTASEVDILISWMPGGLLVPIIVVTAVQLAEILVGPIDYLLKHARCVPVRSQHSRVG